MFKQEKRCEILSDGLWREGTKLSPTWIWPNVSNRQKCPEGGKMNPSTLPESTPSEDGARYVVQPDLSRT